MQESALEKIFVKAVEAIGGIAPKWTSPGSRGVPDRIVILSEGRVAFVELKAPGKRFRALQVWWADKLRIRGHNVYRIDSRQGILDFIEDCKNGRI